MKKILLVDYGSTYFKDVILSFEQLGVECVKLRYDEITGHLDKNNLCGIVLTGSPGRVNNPEDPQLDPALLETGVPILGICYGLQLLMHSLGGKVEALDKRDLGFGLMTIIKESPINKGLGNPTNVWMAHYDHVTKLAKGFEIYASTPISIAMVGDEKRKIYGIQYHPEAKRSDDDMKLLRNFTYDICGYTNM
ncbi:MAG TPA: gamma-glutamyl-gamma-aminobutyrate hydrolase family protein [Bacillota bacterium]|nr:gamma-glutamyl-gamma-aminobutyrate hydrolase family protein [Bacillota bacterium]HPJ86231.1 gamma-glutamyl-gamma-aminobutyrate hydrolase family protein [Bacillota bacterium]HPQ62189.1 gamma-glutamyl-gamma-aminobutyrate hydrolase family protein [Bacillota bacterium]HRX92167.1 gamma-glutamyl-gamma-aminobutyrate hydrolase family protein [Candidatus Izemoplasmatales bacterium]